MYEEFNVHSGKGMSAEVIVGFMYIHYLFEKYSDASLQPNNFYCGITNDVEKNLARHNIDCYLVAYKCDSRVIASKIEEILKRKYYFDIGDVDYGGNGGVDDSVFVYMYRKTSQTKQ